MDKKKSPMKLHTFFFPVICYIHLWKYKWNEANNFSFGVFLLSVNLSVKSLSLDSPINHKSSMIFRRSIYARDLVGKIHVDGPKI
jgi:hypothetical protein